MQRSTARADSRTPAVRSARSMPRIVKTGIENGPVGSFPMRPNTMRAAATRRLRHPADLSIARLAFSRSLHALADQPEGFVRLAPAFHLDPLAGFQVLVVSEEMRHLVAQDLRQLA